MHTVARGKSQNFKKLSIVKNCVFHCLNLVSYVYIVLNVQFRNYNKYKISTDWTNDDFSVAALKYSSLRTHQKTFENSNNIIKLNFHVCVHSHAVIKVMAALAIELNGAGYCNVRTYNAHKICKLTFVTGPVKIDHVKCKLHRVDNFTNIFHSECT